MSKQSRLTWRQYALYRVMSDISEACFCAGWMHGNEFTLWRMVAGGERSYGQTTVNANDVQMLKDISTDIGGWIYWHDDEYEPDCPSEEWGPRFIPIDAWLTRFAASEALQSNEQETPGGTP